MGSVKILIIVVLKHATFKNSIDSSSYFPTPHPSASIHLFSASVDLPILGISCKWDHIISGLLRLISFTEHNFSRFIHVVANVDTAFLSLVESYPTVWI